MSETFLSDSHGRKIRHLRLSLTDQCNFRCVYCMPPEGVPTQPKKNFLSAQETIRLVRIFSEWGVAKIRLTGGEPLVSDSLLEVTEKIRNLPHVQEIALTTNGFLLKKFAAPLKTAGLNRINVSLDSLKRDVFTSMCLRDGLQDVLAGIDAAKNLGFPIKLNTVVMKDINHTEIFDFVHFALQNNIDEVRFIEFMPLCGTGWRPEAVFTLTKAVADLKTRFSTTPVFDMNSVAESFTVTHQGQKTKVGFIQTLSKPFCGHCSRIRLSATGFLQPCLFSHAGINLKSLLAHATDDELKQAIATCVFNKNKENEFAKQQNDKIDLATTLFQNNSQNRTLYPSIRAIGG